MTTVVSPLPSVIQLTCWAMDGWEVVSNTPKSANPACGCGGAGCAGTEAVWNDEKSPNPATPRPVKHDHHHQSNVLQYQFASYQLPGSPLVQS